MKIEEYMSASKLSDKLNFIHICISDLNQRFFSKLKQDKSVVLIIDTYNHNALAEKRRIFIELLNNNINNPVIIGGLFSKRSNYLHDHFGPCTSLYAKTCCRYSNILRKCMT